MLSTSKCSGRSLAEFKSDELPERILFVGEKKTTVRLTQPFSSGIVFIFTQNTTIRTT